MFRCKHIQVVISVNISIAEYQVVGFNKHCTAISLGLERQWCEKESDTRLPVRFAASVVQFREVPKHLKMLLRFYKSDCIPEIILLTVLKW